MDNKKDDMYYTKKILSDLLFISKHTEGLSKADIEANEVLVDSVMFRLIQISENSDRLTTEFKCFNDEIPWRALKGMRNRIVHEYGNVDLEIIYDTLNNDIPKLIEILSAL